jgi:uncharacterized protein (DUF736 family)
MAAKIGEFQKEGKELIGSVETLLIRLKPVRMRPQDKGANYSIHGPDDCELGAAWRKSGQYGDYLSVKLDCPALPAPINAIMSLKANDSGFYTLRWQRRVERDGQSPEREPEP